MNKIYITIFGRPPLDEEEIITSRDAIVLSENGENGMACVYGVIPLAGVKVKTAKDLLRHFKAAGRYAGTDDIEAFKNCALGLVTPAEEREKMTDAFLPLSFQIAADVPEGGSRQDRTHRHTVAALKTYMNHLSEIDPDWVEDACDMVAVLSVATMEIS